MHACLVQALSTKVEILALKLLSSEVMPWTIYIATSTKFGTHIICQNYNEEMELT